MSHVPPEPIRSHDPRQVHHRPAQHPATAGHPRPADVEALVATVQHQFPHALIRITGRGRTVERQAELMAQRRLQNRHQFLNTYHIAPHITEMDHWATTHPDATEDEATAAYTDIINRARQRGEVISNHLTGRARDISIPHGTPEFQEQVRQRLRALGAHVIDERDAVGGAHWHVDY